MGVWDGLDESEISRPEILFQSAPGDGNDVDDGNGDSKDDAGNSGGDVMMQMMVIMTMWW